MGYVLYMSLQLVTYLLLCDHMTCTDFIIERNEKFGGTVKFATYQQLEEAYVKEEVYPLDLKHGVTTHLNQACN